VSMRGSERVEELRGHKYIKLKSGRKLTFWDALEAVHVSHTDQVRALSRAFKLAGTNRDPDLAAYELERLEWAIGELESYLAAVRKEIEKRLGVRSKQERIALLRNTTGRTPEEAAAFTRKADELERQLNENG
jgi:hypothetical protein